MTWPNVIIDHVRAIDLDTPDETEWHGHWNTILFILFPFEEIFSITIKRLARQNGFIPDCNTFIVSLMVTDTKSDGTTEFSQTPLLFLEARSRPELMNESSRRLADEQMRERFSYFSEALRIPRLYGISAMGPQIAVYRYTLATGQVEPAGKPKGVDRVLDTAPSEALWEWDVMSEPGEAKIKRMAEDIKRMVREEWLPAAASTSGSGQT